jgi:hypothetical protein
LRDREHLTRQRVRVEEKQMLSILQVLSGMIVAVAMVQSVAHAPGLPGKLRLAKEQYFAVQQIYFSV